MNCTGSMVPYLTKLEGWGLGTTDLSKITVVGNKSHRSTHRGCVAGR